MENTQKVEVNQFLLLKMQIKTFVWVLTLLLNLLVF